jgi:putative FmdB family regulatory protein
MPIYEFRCPGCGHEFEELVLGHLPLAELRCPKCLKPGVKKLLSSFAGARGASDTAAAAAGSGCGSGGSRFS